MFSTFKEAQDYVRAQQIELVDLLYCDRGVTCTTSRWLPGNSLRT
jgi:hypothetical protein